MLKYHIINLASCRLCPRRAAGGKERRYMDQNDKNKSNKNNDRRRGVLSLLIWALVLTIGFNYLLSAMDTRKLAEGTCEIRYDEFLDLVRDGKVKEVEIADRTLNITPVDGFTYTDADGKTYSGDFQLFTTQINDPELRSFLDENGVEFGKPYKAENDFFGRATALAVTGQLEAETYALAYKRVYTFGPTFRAENSNTKTHAAEFWMIEPEICFCDLNGLMDIEEDFLKSVVQEVLDKAMPELEFLQGYAKSNLIEKLQTLTKSHVARVTHAEAIDILQHATHPFEHPAVQGEDLFKEHEKYLTEEHFKSPVFVYDWPKEIKAFYMYQNDDGKTVRGVDLLVPGSGELMGGSERETRLDLLTGRMDELHISKEQMDWYVNLRRFGGCTHSGFGMGFERLIMYLTDIENIRDVIPYPRTPGNCEF